MDGECSLLSWPYWDAVNVLSGRKLEHSIPSLNFSMQNLKQNALHQDIQRDHQKNYLGIGNSYGLNFVPHKIHMLKF